MIWQPIRYILVLAGCAALSATAFAAEPLRTRRSGDIVVRYHPRDEPKAEQVIAAVERFRQELRNELGIALRKRTQIVLARGREDFERWAGEGIPGWALAIARTRERGIVIDVPRTAPLLANNLVLTLRHELCHIALGLVEEETGRRFPLWFHEGVAVWVSGGSHYGGREDFLVAAAHGQLIPLRDLEERFPAEASEARLAYQQSEDFVAWLATRPGGTPAELIAAFRKGLDFAGAVRDATGRPLGDWERDWREARRERHPWLTTLRHALSLFTVLAIATMLAYVVVRLRRRRVKRRMADEEAWMDSLPDHEFGAPEDDE